MTETLKRHDPGTRMAGVSMGGKFAPSEQTSAIGVRLAAGGLESGEPRPQNGDMPDAGSFCYPPDTHTAEEHISFFENAEIPEITLSNVQFAYEDWMRDKVNTEALAWFHEWEKTDEYKQWEASYVGAGNDPSALFQQHANNKLNRKREEIAATRKMRLRPSEVRPIARYGQMYYRSGHLPEDEAAKLDQHMVSVVEGESVSLNDLAKQYRFSEWLGPAATTSDLRAARNTERLWQLLEERL